MTPRSRVPAYGIRVATGVVILLCLGGCSDGAPSVLDPRSASAARIADLWWWMLGVSSVVLLVVVGMIAYAIVRGRRRTEEEARGRVPWGEPFIIIAGIVVSGIVLLVFFVVSLQTMRALAEPSEDPELTIEVVAHDWWWEARYPNGGVTANEIHIPAGEPVRLELTTADVIHSFWVPQLGPKMDMIPGRTNELVLEADDPGRYRGQCAEYCGLQHANMILFVVAQEPDAFDDWMDHEAQPAEEPTSDLSRRGREVFLGSTCAACHTIRGTPAEGALGPDLTHLASRETLAAGVLENDAGNLTLWIEAPQSVKPGATMPPTELSSDELGALVAYLSGLE